MASNQAISLTRPGEHASAAKMRALDMVFAATGLFILLPLFLLISLAILYDTGRPVLFAQTRLGRGGRHFRMLKFRKFRNDVGPDGLPLTMPNDERLTPVGKFIDTTKLNELPQLWNVLSGEMSIVGPRPETLDFADCFVGRYQGVLDYKPGILGPSQVAFRHEASLFPEDCDHGAYYREVLFPTKADIDLRYYRTRTLRSDLGWMIRGMVATLSWKAPATFDLPSRGEPPATVVKHRGARAPVMRKVRYHSDRVARVVPVVGRPPAIE